MTHVPRSRARLFPTLTGLGALAASFAAFPAAAQEDCPTWFPDLRCEREGRPEGFVAPVSAGYLFEDPFITTGLSAWYIYQGYPESSLFDGGHLNAMALQARIAITDRLAFIATKDGFVWNNPDLAIVDDDSGFVNIAAGFKYALIDRREDNFILTPALRIEAPTGGTEVYSGYGDGVIIPSVSSAWGIADFHTIGSLGVQVPFNTSKQSTMLFYNLHLDYAVLPYFVPLVEFNGYHWIGSGNGRIPIETDLGTVDLNTAQALLGKPGFEGQDLLNLGSRDVAGKDIVTFAVGARIPITRKISFGAVYEFPLTEREDLLDQRVMANLLVEF